MRWTLIGAGVLAGLYCLFGAALFLLQRQILYRPDKTRPDLTHAAIPGLREMTVTTADGLGLLAWYLAPERDDGLVVLYLHGNAGNIQDRAYRLASYRRPGWGVLMLEYRGYGGNPGNPSETGLIADGRAGLAALRAMGFASDRILLWGESLGSGIAVRLAVEQPVAAVLLEAPYTSITGIARLRYSYMPVDWLLLDRFDSLHAIGGVRAPVLVMLGARDQIIPPAMGRAIYEAAPEPKQLWVAPDAGHVDLIEAGAVIAASDFVNRIQRDPRLHHD
jgi:uncharacterized protein